MRYYFAIATVLPSSESKNIIWFFYLVCMNFSCIYLGKALDITDSLFKISYHAKSILIIR